MTFGTGKIHYLTRQVRIKETEIRQTQTRQKASKNCYFQMENWNTNSAFSDKTK